MNSYTAWQRGADQINTCSHLFALDIRQREDLTLSLDIVEAKPQEPVSAISGDNAFEFLKLGGRPIQQDVTCRQFHLVFEGSCMISYSVLSESYSTYPAASEVFTGQLFRCFSESRLLDYMRATTHADALHPGALMHFEIVCENHVIDVICTSAPAISLTVPDVGN